MLGSVLAYRIPWPVALMAMFLFGSLIWWIEDREPQILEIATTSQESGGPDTLYITSDPDTIFIEKIVYKEVKRRAAIDSFGGFPSSEVLEPEGLLAIEKGHSLRSDSILQELLVTDL